MKNGNSAIQIDICSCWHVQQIRHRPSMAASREQSNLGRKTNLTNIQGVGTYFFNARQRPSTRILRLVWRYINRSPDLPVRNSGVARSSRISATGARAMDSSNSSRCMSFGRKRRPLSTRITAAIPIKRSKYGTRIAMIPPLFLPAKSSQAFIFPAFLSIGFSNCDVSPLGENECSESLKLCDCLIATYISKRLQLCAINRVAATNRIREACFKLPHRRLEHTHAILHSAPNPVMFQFPPSISNPAKPFALHRFRIGISNIHLEQLLAIAQ